MVDSESIIEIYRSLKKSIRIVMKYTEVLKFVLDHLKTKELKNYLL